MEELNELYCARNAISIIQSRRVRWLGHVPQERDETCVQGFGVETEGKQPLGRLHRDRRII